MVQSIQLHEIDPAILTCHLLWKREVILNRCSNRGMTRMNDSHYHPHLHHHHHHVLITEICGLRSRFCWCWSSPHHQECNHDQVRMVVMMMRRRREEDEEDDDDDTMMTTWRWWWLEVGPLSQNQRFLYQSDGDCSISRPPFPRHGMTKDEAGSLFNIIDADGLISKSRYSKSNANPIFPFKINEKNHISHINFLQNEFYPGRSCQSLRSSSLISVLLPRQTQVFTAINITNIIKY